MARGEGGSAKTRSGGRGGGGQSKNTSVLPSTSSSSSRVGSTSAPVSAPVPAGSTRRKGGDAVVLVKGGGAQGEEEEESSDDRSSPSSSSSSSSSPSPSSSSPSSQSNQDQPSSLQPSDRESPVHSSSSFSSSLSSPAPPTSSSLVSDSFLSSPSPLPGPSSSPPPPPLPQSALSSPSLRSATKQSSSSLAYFTSYGDPQVHSHMLRDAPRTSAYHRAVQLHASLFENSYVMDVGAGSGILSLFAARTGKAKRVYAVEPSDAFYLLQEIVEVNNLKEVILPIHATVETLIFLSRRQISRHLSAFSCGEQGGTSLRAKEEQKKAFEVKKGGGSVALNGKEKVEGLSQGMEEDENKKEKNKKKEKRIKKTRFSTEEEEACGFYDLESEGEEEHEREDEATLLAREGVKAFLDEQLARFVCTGKKSSLFFIDILISEWMGFYLLHEGMLDSVLKARDAFLRKDEKKGGGGGGGGGHMFPSHARLYLSLADCSEYWAKRLRCFTNFHGFNFTPLQHALQESLHRSRQPLLIQLKPGQCAACDPVVLFEWNLAALDRKALQNLSSQVVLRQKRRGPVHAFALWFECEFSSSASSGRQVHQRNAKKDRGTPNGDKRHERSRGRESGRGVVERKNKKKETEKADFSVKQKGTEKKEATEEEKDDERRRRRRKKRKEVVRETRRCCSSSSSVEIECEDCQEVLGGEAKERESQDDSSDVRESSTEARGAEGGRAGSRKGEEEEGEGVLSSPSVNNKTPRERKEESDDRKQDRRQQTVVLDTSPFSQETHWKQTLVVLPHPPLETTPNLLLTCLVQLRKEHSSARSYEVSVEVLEANMAEEDAEKEERTDDDEEDDETAEDSEEEEEEEEDESDGEGEEEEEDRQKEQEKKKREHGSGDEEEEEEEEEGDEEHEAGGKS